MHFPELCAPPCSQEQAPANVPAQDQDLEAQLQQAMSLKSRPHPVGRDRRQRSTSLASVVPPRLVCTGLCVPALMCMQMHVVQLACRCCHTTQTPCWLCRQPQ